MPTTIAGDHVPADHAEADVLVVEPGPRSIQTVLRTLPRSPRLPPVLIVGADIPAGAVTRLLHAGVCAVLPRDASAPKIAAAIEAAAAGLVVLHPSRKSLAVAGTRGGKVPSAPRASSLTPGNSRCSR